MSEKELSNLAKELLKFELKAQKFNVKWNVVGASTIFTDREIWLKDWYAGFWDTGKTDLKLGIAEAIKRIVNRIKSECVSRTVAIGDVFVEITEHFDTRDKYYNVCVCFGGY